ncbi:Hypothetical predicted protein, partial [Olea europaea subsp. europaea]
IFIASFCGFPISSSLILLQEEMKHQERLREVESKNNSTTNYGKQSNTSDKANIAEHYLSDGDLLAICDAESKCEEKWILDTTCAFYMCPNQNLFETYETMTQSVVVM